MTYWNIAYAVSAVLNDVAGHVTGGDGLLAEIKAFDRDVKGAAAAAQSKAVTKALGEFQAAYAQTLAGIATKTTRCVQGATTATKGYLLADEEMRANAIRNAASAPAPRLWGTGR
ncbi:DUF6507 family protein [Spirillospora sp. CA-255316]